MSKKADIGDTYARMVKELNGVHDMRYIVVMLHLYLEFWLDKIIEKKCKNSKKIMEFNFFQKLRILNGFDIVPDELFHDIKVINELRNTFAHELDIPENEIDTKLIQLKTANSKKALDSPTLHVRLIISITALMGELFSIYVTSDNSK